MALLFPHPPSLSSLPNSISNSIKSKLIRPIRTPFPSIPTLRSNPQFLTPKPPTIPTPDYTIKKTLTPNSSPFAASETADFSLNDLTLDLAADDDEDLAGSPWEGAVVYRRDASVSHVECCTTLERLGLGKLSTGVSKSRASAMGIRIPARRPKDSGVGGDGTPVLVSLDVTRRKRRLKLDGIVRTVITLGCNRCAEPAAECIFSNFTLLLTEDPIEEPEDEINMGVIYGEEKRKTFTGITAEEEEEEDDEHQIDPDDRLHFPSEEKEIDISKHIRDIVHVEITMNAICDTSCKGLCLKCGTNLNKSSCKCSREVQDSHEHGPLKNLRKEMQKR